MWKTRAEFERDLFASYLKSGLQRPQYKIVPFGAELFKVRDKRNQAPKRRLVGPSVIDDLLLDAIVWHHSLAMRLGAAKIGTRHRAFQRALFALLMRVVQDSMVVRNLIKGGYDVQGRNLLRSIFEHIDTIYYLCFVPSASREFVRTNEEESSNKFWWEHIRRSRKMIDEHISQKLKLPEWVEWEQFRAAEQKMLSSTHHPSYVACTVPFIVPGRGTDIAGYMFGGPPEYTYRTGKLLFFALAEAALCIGALNERMNGIIRQKRGSVIQTMVRKGRVHLLTMLLHLSENWKAPIFEVGVILPPRRKRRRVAPK